jgi:ABC-type glycerol-3-phosphate transport system permease component
VRIRSLFLLFWTFVLVVPFLTALLLSVGVSGTSGYYHLNFSVETALANYGAVLFGRPGLPEESRMFLEALGITAQISWGAAFVTVLMAMPVAARLAVCWRKYRWTAAAVAIGTRTLPITVAVPVFSGLSHHLGLPLGRPMLTMLYIFIFLPLGCAMLSAADWHSALINEHILALDAPLGIYSRAVYRVKALAGDLAVTIALLLLLCWSDAFLPAYFLDPRTPDITAARLLDRQQGFLETEWGLLGAAIVSFLAPLGLIALAFVLGVWVVEKRRVFQRA